MNDDSMHASAEPPPMNCQEPVGQPVDWRETLPAIEFCCWLVVLLLPFLRCVNGPAVTDDQATIQFCLASLAITSALVLRIWNWRRARRD